MTCNHIVGSLGASDFVRVSSFPAKHKMYIDMVDKFNRDVRDRNFRKTPVPPMAFAYYNNCPECGTAIKWQKTENGLIPVT